MKKALAIFVKVVITLVGGWVLAGVIASLPYEMPSWLDTVIRLGLRATGNDGLANPDDIEVIATLVTLVACIAVVAVVVWALSRFVMKPALRWFANRRAMT